MSPSGLSRNLPRGDDYCPAPAVGLLREIPGELPAGADKLAKRIKAVRLWHR